MSERLRLDQALVARGLQPSRARARDAIRRGAVTVNGAPARRPAMAVGTADVIALDDAAAGYVSRAALKLAAALDRFAVEVEGLTCLDLGASTGGFTQVLLARGAAHVTAVEVGHGQLAPALATDPRVTLLEGLNARDLTPAHLAAPSQLIVCDVSFISLKLALPAALGLAAPGARLIALVKPQFEVGRAALGKGGIVRDPALHAAVCADIADWLSRDRGWLVLGLMPSPVAGGDGNREFLIAAEKP